VGNCSIDVVAVIFVSAVIEEENNKRNIIIHNDENSVSKTAKKAREKY
jgi:hypothetical protein